jgi:hypothetical protein
MHQVLCSIPCTSKDKDKWANGRHRGRHCRCFCPILKSCATSTTPLPPLHDLVYLFFILFYFVGLRINPRTCYMLGRHSNQPCVLIFMFSLYRYRQCLIAAKVLLGLGAAGSGLASG